MKTIILFAVALLVCPLVYADFFAFQDNTHKHSLRCCNGSGYCVDMEDISYVFNNTEIHFNEASLTGNVTCFEVGNKMQVNIKDAVLSSPIELVLFFVSVLLGVAVFGYTFNRLRGKPT